MNTFQLEWCGGLSRIDRKQICSSVLAFLRQNNPAVSYQFLLQLAVSLEESAYHESACPVYYVETVVTRLHQAQASISITPPRQSPAVEQLPYQHAPYQHAPYQHAPHPHAPHPHAPHQHTPQHAWRNSITREERNVVLRHMILKLTSFNEGESPRAITEAATVFENCTYVSVDSKFAYLSSIAEELSRCEACHTLPAPSAEVLSLSLQQQCQNQPCETPPQITQTHAITDSLPVPPTPNGPQNILNLEPGELMSHVFEQPNWKDLLTAGDRHTIVRHIYSKLTALNLNETTQQMYKKAISFELDAFTRAETGCSYLEYLIGIIGALQPVCIAEAILPPRGTVEQVRQPFLQPDITNLSSISEQGSFTSGQ